MRLNSMFFIFFLIYINLGFTQSNYKEKARGDIHDKNINYYFGGFKIDSFEIIDSIFKIKPYNQRVQND